jgi:hypothetical protein
MAMIENTTLRRALFHALTEWDRRCNRRNHHAGAIALGRLDEAMIEIEAGRDVLDTLRDCFNDRLLTYLEKAAERCKS